MNNNYSPWVDTRYLNKNALIRIFCFPYAGGDSREYYSWNKYLPEEIDLCPIQLPGRGTRFHEPLRDDLNDIIEELSYELTPMINSRFVFFGHSMGSMIAYELAANLYNNFNVLPLHLFVSGARAPHIPRRRKPIFNLPDDEFISELEKYDGTPKEIIENNEVMELVLPILRNDFKLVETYKHVNKIKLNCPLTAIGGIDDNEVTHEDISAWNEYTHHQFSLHKLPGGHFFIKQSQKMLLQLLSKKLYDTIRLCNN